MSEIPEATPQAPAAPAAAPTPEAALSASIAAELSKPDVATPEAAPVIPQPAAPKENPLVALLNKVRQAASGMMGGGNKPTNTESTPPPQPPITAA